LTSSKFEALVRTARTIRCNHKHHVVADRIRRFPIPLRSMHLVFSGLGDRKVQKNLKDRNKDRSKDQDHKDLSEDQYQYQDLNDLKDLKNLYIQYPYLI